MSHQRQAGRAAWMWTGLMTALSAAALAVVACDPPPTAIPPGPTAIVAGPVKEQPLPSTPIDPPAMVDADAGPAGSASPDEAEASPPAAGEAAGEASGLTRDGGLCEKGAECASGICEGMGCTPERKGVCMARNRSCTRDLRTYCGCDGQTFRGSGSCPGQRYSARSACR